MAVTRMQILAPVASLADAELVHAAGADMLYCGFQPAGWGQEFGEIELISRRQGGPAHITHAGELAAVAGFARGVGCEATLTINGHYTRGQLGRAMDLAELWEQLGGTGLMVADVGLLAALRERGTAMTLCASILTGAFNASSIRFLADLGAARVVLPRELCLDEVRTLVSSAPDLQFEMIVLHQRCPFIDGFCRFYHGSRIPSGQPAEFSYAMTGEGGAVAAFIDPDYEGHGCQLDWRTDEGPVGLEYQFDALEPPCAACRLNELRDAGVTIAKVAGRGYPPELIARSVAFLVCARELGSRPEAAGMIRALYLDAFRHPCGDRDCYYGPPEMAR